MIIRHPSPSFFRFMFFDLRCILILKDRQLCQYFLFQEKSAIRQNSFVRFNVIWKQCHVRKHIIHLTISSFQKPIIWITVLSACNTDTDFLKLYHNYKKHWTINIGSKYDSSLIVCTMCKYHIQSFIYSFRNMTIHLLFHKEIKMGIRYRNEWIELG